MSLSRVPEVSEVGIEPTPDQKLRQRAEFCWSEVQTVLQKHRCELVPTPTFAPDRGGVWVVQVGIQVQPVPDPPVGR